MSTRSGQSLDFGVVGDGMGRRHRQLSPRCSVGCRCQESWNGQVCLFKRAYSRDEDIPEVLFRWVPGEVHSLTPEGGSMTQGIIISVAAQELGHRGRLGEVAHGFVVSSSSLQHES